MAHPLQVARYLELFDGSYEEVEKFFTTQGHEVYKTIRVNTLKISVEELAKRLMAKGLKLRPYEPTPYGLIVDYTPVSIGALHEYMQGYYTIQGPASMLPVIALRPEENEDGIVLDCCAGAGVKTTQIAQHVPMKPILAIDVNKRKLRALKNNLSRMGVLNVVAVNIDARKLPSSWPRDLELPTHILIDAPCSGEGLWPYPRGKWPRTRRDIVSRVHIQVELLLSILRLAIENTVIVYSTCSTSVEENEYVVNEVLDVAGDAIVLEDPRIPGIYGKTEYLGLQFSGDVAKCRRLLPHLHHTEGFTICRLRIIKPVAKRLVS